VADNSDSERSFRFRGVAAGLAGVLLISLLTPYNNYVVNNTDMIGSFLPTSVVLLLVIAALLNGFLTRFAPCAAFSKAELTIALGMTLVACAFPAVGMMRYLPGHLVSPFYHAANDPESKKVLEEAAPADWLFPTFETTSTDPAVRGTDPVVTGFVGRVTIDDQTFIHRVSAVPWRAWVRPAVTWGIFFAALLGAVVCLTVIFREQWVVAERLAFPLATIYLALVEPPEPQRFLNGLLSNPRFWITVACVMAVDLLFGLNQYFPTVPAINLSIDMRSLMSEAPLVFTDWSFKSQGIFFTIIGITFFMQSKVAFSLWFLFVMSQVARMFAGTYGADFSTGMETDQIFGSTAIFGCMILWLARQRLAMIVRHMFRAPKPSETPGRYLSHRASGWGLLLCVAASVMWLWMAGTSLIGAVLIVLILLVLYTVLAKVIAETGLLYVLIPVPVNRVWVYAAQDLPGGARSTIGTYFFSSVFSGMLTHDQRQSLAPFATHALRIADEQPAITRRAGVYLMWLVVAMVLAYVASGAASLYIHYNYALTLDSTGNGLDNDNWGWFNMPKVIGLAQTQEFIPPRNGPVESHSRAGFFGIGAGITAALAWSHLRWPAFPLHPIGFLLVYTWGLRMTWFSIFVGWLAKVLVVRLGGSRLLTTMRAVFLGLIVGEAMAAAIWLIVSLILAQYGFEYKAIRLLPA